MDVLPEADPLTSAASTPVIRTEQLTRWFGNIVAVNDVTLDIRPGITGLLGPNGAGKSTLIRMIAGLARVSSGTVTIFGEPVRDNPLLSRRLGVMLEHETVYGFMTGRQFVRLMGELRGVTPLDEAVERAIGHVELHDAADRKISTYSRGMRQRIRLAGMLVHDPEVLLLDEPLNGADPRQRLHFQTLLRRFASEGRTIVISSHILEEIERIADTVLLFVNGKLAASGDFRAIRAALNERPYHVLVACDSPRSLASAVVQLDCVEAVKVDPDGRIVIQSRNVRDLQIELPRLAQRTSVTLHRVVPLDDSLESVFGYLVDGREQ